MCSSTLQTRDRVKGHAPWSAHIRMQIYSSGISKATRVPPSSIDRSRLPRVKNVEDRRYGAGMVIVVFGVTGTGKTRVGSALAEALGWVFIDADDFHEEANLTKLNRGIPLNDEDRRPWLAHLRGLIQESLTQRRNAVLACSALKRAYRRYLRVGPEVVFVYLRTETHVLEKRLKGRQDHFMNQALLQSQLEALEEPLDETLTVDTARSPAEIVGVIRDSLKL